MWVKSKIVCDDELRSFYNDEVPKIKSYLEKEYQSKKEEIVARYKSCEGNKLLPFISEQKYNVAIKRIFKAAGMKRVLYEIASSHICRKPLQTGERPLSRRLTQRTQGG